MIHRIEHNENFTVIANETVRNTDLSDGAIRLLFFMLSCSDDYQFSTKGLAHVFDVSESTIVDRVVELKSKGYIQTTNRKNENRLCRDTGTLAIAQRDCICSRGK